MELEPFHTVFHQLCNQEASCLHELNFIIGRKMAWIHVRDQAVVQRVRPINPMETLHKEPYPRRAVVTSSDLILHQAWNVGLS